MAALIDQPTTRRELPLQHVRRGRRRRSVTEVARQAPSSRTRSQPVATHQALDRVQPALYPGSQQVVPHTPSAVGAIARRKARFDLRAQHLVTTRAGTRAPPQPRIKPAARDTEPLAENRHRPDPPVLRNEPCPVLREVGGGFFRMSRSAFSFCTSRRSRSISACSGLICPCPGKSLHRIGSEVPYPIAQHVG
jgi:hypothetical protein